MLQGKLVLLRAARRDDMIAIYQYNNDVEVELAGGGDPPIPQSIERLLADFDTEAGKGGRNGTSFIIDADDHCIGFCALFHFDDAARTAALGFGPSASSSRRNSFASSRAERLSALSGGPHRSSALRSHSPSQSIAATS